MFGGQRRKLPELRDGLHVVVQAQLVLYEARGDLQLQVEAIEPVGTGRFQLQLEQLKRKLAAEGLFSAARKKPIPSWPRRIGVITSPTGAAIRDVLKVLRKRFPAIEVILYPCQVQGEEAPQEISWALEVANRRRECDLLLLVRGGGSAEDLAAFNEEAVVRAVAASNLPVVTGIGHEIDFTLADLATDLRAPTPSAAAERVSPDRQALYRHLRQLAVRLYRALQQQLQRRWEKTKNIEQWLQGRAHPRKRLFELEQACDELQMSLREAMQRQLSEKGPQLSNLAKLLYSLNPLKILERGYAIATDGKGRVVIDVQTLKPGEKLTLKLARGRVDCRVEVIEDD